MSPFAIQQETSVSCEEMAGNSPISCVEKRDGVVCPKPRRLGLIHAIELLDIVLAKGGADQSVPQQVAWSPPFFSGSPPSRVSNPLIQDARFGSEKSTPVSPGSFPSPSSSGKGGCIPAVRVEGFDCLDRDRRNCSIPALA